MLYECIVGTIERIRDAERLFYATNLVDKWFDELSRVAAVKTKPLYNFHPLVGTDDQEIKCKALGDGTVTEIHEVFKGDTIKKLVYSAYCSISVIKLTMLDEYIAGYLLYSLLSM